MSFTSKAEADAHDKMLDMVEALCPLLEQSGVLTDEKHVEDIALFLARERDQVLIALGAKKPTKKKAPPANTDSAESSKPKAVA